MLLHTRNGKDVRNGKEWYAKVAMLLLMAKIPKIYCPGVDGSLEGRIAGRGKGENQKCRSQFGSFQNFAHEDDFWKKNIKIKGKQRF